MAFSGWGIFGALQFLLFSIVCLFFPKRILKEKFDSYNKFKFLKPFTGSIQSEENVKIYRYFGIFFFLLFLFGLFGMIFGEPPEAPP
jgi:hypothetical protein